MGFKTRDFRDYQLAADRGLTKVETAKAFNVLPQTVSRMASRYGIIFKSGRKVGKTPMKIRTPDGLNPKQRRDFETLVRGGYTDGDAINIVANSERRKIRAPRNEAEIRQWINQRAAS